MSEPGDGPYRSVAITGAGGYVGRLLVSALARDRRRLQRIVATDLSLPADGERVEGVEYDVADVCTDDLADLLRRHGSDAVVHLAAVVTPGRDSTREQQYRIDVVGTERVLEACVATGVRKLIYTSSGAAYGYHADNPARLVEEDRLRGNPEFAYADHKRQVEEMLARWRQDHPELLQLIFRVGTILGATTDNQITRIFDADTVRGLSGKQSPFVIVWDEDVAGAIALGIHRGGAGIFNLAGDGTLTLSEAAELMAKPYRAVPAGLLRFLLAVAKPLGLSPHGPEQVLFLQHRPVLDNRRLKEEFGYTPARTTREAFEVFLAGRAARRREGTPIGDA